MPKKDKKNMTLKERILDNIYVFASAYAIAFVIRMLLIEAYQIPSQSMVPSLLVKDILMVEKVSMGPRIPVLNIKIPGFLKPQRNDIIVFVHPGWRSPGIAKEVISMLTLYLVNLDNTFDSPKNLVKRLVGMPGDTISMSNKILTINGKRVGTDFVSTQIEVLYERLEKTRNESFDIFTEKFDGRQRIIQHLYGIDSYFKAGYDSRIKVLGSDNFVNDSKVNESRMLLLQDFPEIKVPKKGEVIQLKSANGYYKYLLKILIENESRKKVDVVNGKFFVDGKEITEWKAGDNYYFGMGDNRDYSEDCRYFGFIPEKNIFGRILFRYFPFDRLGFDVNDTDKTILKRGNQLNR